MSSIVTYANCCNEAADWPARRKLLRQPPQMIKIMRVSLSPPHLLSCPPSHSSYSLSLLCIFPPFSSSLPHGVRVQDVAEHSVPLRSHVFLLSLVFSLRMRAMRGQKICFLSHYFPPTSWPVPHIIVPDTSLSFVHALW